MVLQKTGLAGCKNPETCTAVADTRRSPPPAAHFHIDTEITISIYKQSSTLWFLPTLELSPDSIGKSPDIILASDPCLPPQRPGRGHGAFRPTTLPVYSPSAHRLLEAYIRLLARAQGSMYGSFWLAMITYICEYVDGDGLLDEARLPVPYGTFYSGLKTFEQPVRALLEALRASLAGSATL